MSNFGRTSFSRMHDFLLYMLHQIQLASCVFLAYFIVDLYIMCVYSTF